MLVRVKKWSNSYFLWLEVKNQALSSSIKLTQWQETEVMDKTNLQEE